MSYEGILKVLTDERFRQKLVGLGKKQSMDFTWQKCAQQTLSVMEAVFNGIEKI